MSAATTTALQSYFLDRRRSRAVGFAALLGILVFGVVSVELLDIPVSRLSGMFGPLGRMIGERLMPPEFAYATSGKILLAVVETVEMSLLGALIGTLITVPLAWFAAWNVTPSRQVLYPLARMSIVLGRAVPSLMWGLLLVTIFGFGPFPGVLALVVGTIGFAGKLMAEQVEAIDMKPVEAMRATGAGSIKVFIYGVLPQVKPAWAGVVIYNWDARLRSSTILGFVGAGGIGIHLREKISVLEYHSAMGIILIIIALVICSEAISHVVRKKLA